MLAQLLRQWMPPSIGGFSSDIDELIRFIFYIILPWFFVAEGVLFYALWRYRRRRGTSARAQYQTGTTLRALAWVIAPAVMILGFDLWIDAESAQVWEKVKLEVPASGQHVRVTGAQFFWKFTYPGPDEQFGTADDFTVDNELHVQSGKPVIFELESTDVIHSFFIPPLRLKQDVVPGRRIRGWFQADTAGVYEIVCSQLCGLGHTRMRGWLHVHSPDDYKTWIDQQHAPSGADSFWQ